MDFIPFHPYEHEPVAWRSLRREASDVDEQDAFFDEMVGAGGTPRPAYEDYRCWFDSESQTRLRRK